MLVSELPTTATVVSTGVWTDRVTQSRYVVDPSDATLLLARAWTPKELSDWNQAQVALTTNQTTLTSSLTASIAALVADIGLAQSDPLLVKDSTSLNGILASTTVSADFTANPSLWIKNLARFIKHTNKAIIANGKIATGSFTDASTGQ